MKCTAPHIRCNWIFIGEPSASSRDSNRLVSIDADVPENPIIMTSSLQGSEKDGVQTTPLNLAAEAGVVSNLMYL